MRPLSWTLLALAWRSSISRLTGVTPKNHNGRVLQEEYIVFQEVGGLVVMEAESVPITEPWKLEKSLPGYSGNGYIRFDGNTVTGGPPDGFLSFHFSIQSEGEYFMTFRSNKNYTDDGTWSNDCYTKLDSTTSGTTLYDSTKTYAGGQPNQWSWKLNFDLENGEKPVPSFDLVGGEYELVIAGRSKNFFIDRIVIFQADLVSSDVVMDETEPESASALSSNGPAVSAVAPVETPVVAPTSNLHPVSPPVSPPVLSSVSSSAIVIDAGSDDEDVSLISGIHWKSYFPEDISGSVAPFQADYFKSHRSGEYFTYAIPGFQPGQEANIILGFAENWLANCRPERNRNINVVINGKSFIEGLNIYGDAGCYNVVEKSGTFFADESGVFIIAFTSSNPSQNPLVSAISIDPIVAGEGDGGVEIEGGDVQDPTTSAIVNSIVLVSADDRSDIMTIKQGDVINLDELTTRALSIRVNTTSEVEWIRFFYDGLTKSEGSPPFVLGGKMTGCCFNSVPYLEFAGNKTVVMNFFGGGDKLDTVTLTFELTGGGDFGQAGEQLEDKALFPVPDVIINCGSLNETDDIVSGEFTRKYSSVEPIENVPSIYEEEVFQTHRSGNSPFTYTIGGFDPSQQAEITLGFAETWKPNCDFNKRLMNIAVNGVVFARNFDVFALAGGCNKAFLISREFEADVNGVFAINFSSTVQDPMISLISVDAADGLNGIPTFAPAISSELLSDAPSLFPSDMPSTTASDLPSGSPHETGDAIIGLTLVNATGRDILGVFNDGAVIDLSIVGIDLSIVADAIDTVTHVRFFYEGIAHTEGVAPFSMGGKLTSCCFSSVPYLSFPGNKTVEVDAFDSFGRIFHLPISFTVINSANENDSIYGEAGFTVDEDAPAFDVLVDAGSESDLDGIVTSQDSREYSSNETIDNVPSYFDEAMFQSHRAGHSAPLIYNFSGYEDGVWAEVTLGFAEIWKPNCKIGKRVMDVAVNGKPFAESLDVFNVEGCFSALVMTNTYQADATGSFVIELSASVQKPMVSVIGFETLEVNLSDAPSLTPSDTPSLSPSSYPSSVPSNVPSDTPSTSFAVINSANEKDLIYGEAGFTADEDAPPDFDVLVDAGSESDLDGIVTSQDSRKYFSNETIDNVPSYLDEAMFQSHRAGESSPLIYNFSGYEDGVWAEVTLGFAEIWKPNCKIGKRVMDVAVNGKPFAESLDVFNVEGCFSALVMTNTYQADATGSFVIELSASVQKPMVSVIGIETLEVKLSDAPSLAPSDTLSLPLSNNPSSVPSDAPSDAPSLSPSSVPSVHNSLPSDVPSVTPLTSSRSVPTSVSPSNEPSSIPSSAPVSVAVDAPASETTIPPTGQAITGLYLVRASDRSEIRELRSDHDAIDVNEVGTELSVRADTVGSVVWVRFQWDGLVHSEGSLPFVMDGKAGASAYKSVEYLATPTSEHKEIIVDAFDENNVRVDRRVVDFFVIGLIADSYYVESGVESSVPTTVFVDAGSESDTNGLVSGIYWESSFPDDISGVPDQYDPESFKTHRSGGYFTYTIPGFKAGEEADVTLGFAENYEPNCHDGKRLFAVSVNDEFWDNVDVYKMAGCKAAYVMTKTFQANADGEFAIAFTSVNNNPFVAMIDISTSLGAPAEEPQTTTEGDSGPIETLLLFDAANRTELGGLQNGAELSLSTLGTTDLTIVVEVSSAVERIRFTWGADSIHNEGSTPYAMEGKAGSTAFKSVAYLSELGSDKAVVVTAFGAGDTVLGTYALEFSVVA